MRGRRPRAPEARRTMRPAQCRETGAGAAGLLESPELPPDAELRGTYPMASAIAAYLHFVTIFMLFALLALEHRLFRLPLVLERARALVIVDLAYGVFAGLVLLTGVARAIWFEKGPEYYLYNGIFLTKVGLFIFVGLLSSFP